MEKGPKSLARDLDLSINSPNAHMTELRWESDLVLGVDVGTSYIKLVLADRTGAVVHSARIRSKTLSAVEGIDYCFTSDTWRVLYEILQGVCCWAQSNKFVVGRIAVAAISPVLVGFSLRDPDFAICMPYWRIKSVDQGLSGMERASARVRHLSKSAVNAGMTDGVFCDLIGYVNYRLTGHLTINSITLAELCAPDEPYNIFATLDVLGPSDSLAVKSEQFPIGAYCAGGSDSFCTALGAGAIEAGSELIYLGTFGSLLRVHRNLLLSTSQDRTLPYEWVFSSPRFGASVERLAESLFPDGAGNPLSRLDEHASITPLGACETLFHIPRAHLDGVESWDHGFAVSPGGSFSKSTQARAVLEALPVALLALGITASHRITPIYVNGGGATSSVWPNVLADCLYTPVRRPRINVNGNGPLTLALLSESSRISLDGQWIEIQPMAHDRNELSKTIELAKAWYGSHT